MTARRWTGSTILVSCAAACLFLACGCGDDDGGAVVTSTMTCAIDGVPTDFSSNAHARYNLNPDYTSVAGNSSGHDLFVICFPGSGTGYFENPTGGASIFYHGGIPSGIFEASDSTAGSSYLISVTAYGPVGSLVEGIFSGTIVDGGGTPIAVSGSFSAVREPDETF